MPILAITLLLLGFLAGGVVRTGPITPAGNDLEAVGADEYDDPCTDPRVNCGRIRVPVG